MVLEANGSNMSGNQQDHTTALAKDYMNTTGGLGSTDQRMNAALFEFKVFNIIIAALALCILCSTGLYCVTVCYNRNKQLKRAHMYESAVTRDSPVSPVAVKAVRRSTSFMNPFALFRKSERARDNSKIYYIYSNPLPIGLEEEETTSVPCGLEDQAALPQLPSIREYAKDPASGIILDPPIFYMQL